MGTVRIGSRDITYHVKIGRSAKYAHLTFTPDLELNITLPRESDIDVQALLEKKRAWITRKYAELSRRKCVFSDTSVMYKGRYYDLRIVPQTRRSRVEVKKRILVIPSAEQDDPLSLLKEWMTAETTELLTRELPRHAERFNIKLEDVVVRNIKRWGYCSKTGTLVFTWQLIALPDSLVEYIMLHELAHLSEFSHSRKFWIKLASMCPDFRERQQALNSFCTSETVDLQTSELIRLSA